MFVPVFLTFIGFFGFGEENIFLRGKLTIYLKKDLYLCAH
jgi:hypothetical protein